jgi:hypothetical protein
MDIYHFYNPNDYAAVHNRNETESVLKKSLEKIFGGKSITSR